MGIKNKNISVNIKKKSLSNCESSKRFRVSFQKLRRANFDMWNRFYFKLKNQTFSTSRVRNNLLSKIKISHCDPEIEAPHYRMSKATKYLNNPLRYNFNRLSESFEDGDDEGILTDLKNTSTLSTQKRRFVVRRMCSLLNNYSLYRRVKRGHPKIVKVLCRNFGIPTLKFDVRRIGRTAEIQKGLYQKSYAARKRFVRVPTEEFRRRMSLKKERGILVCFPPRIQRIKKIAARKIANRKFFRFYFGRMKRLKLVSFFLKIRRLGFRRDFIFKMESRLDRLLLRTQLVRNLFSARIAIKRGHFSVNGITIYSLNYQIRPYDIISVNAINFISYRKNLLRRLFLGMFRPSLPRYLEVNYRLLYFVYVPSLTKLSAFKVPNKFYSFKMPRKYL